MQALQRLRAALEALPAGTAITIGRETLLELLSEDVDCGSNEEATGVQADLNVPQVAQLFGRSANTVRRWIGTGELEAYKLLGREWRITPAALRAFQIKQREGRLASRSGNRRATPLSDWRKVQSTVA